MSQKPVHRRYEVKPEDTLRSIAHKYGVTVKELALLNGISNQNPLFAGEHIFIPQTQAPPPRSRLVPWLMLGAAVVVVGVLLGLLISTHQSAEAAALSLTQAQDYLVAVEQTSTQAVVGLTQTAILWTATPSPTATSLPTIAAGAIGRHWTMNAPDKLFKSNEVLGDGAFSVIEVWGANPGYQAHVYLNQGASVKVSSVDQTSGLLALQSETGDFLVESGSFKGVSVRSRGSSVEFELAGSCMIVNNEPTVLSMACLEGTCSYTMLVGDPSVALPVGQKIIFEKTQSTPQTVMITSADVMDYIDNMVQIGGETALLDLNECGLRGYQSSSGSTHATAAPKPISTKTGTSQTCAGSLVLQNGTCVCPAGTVRNGDQCQRASSQSIQPTSQPVGNSGNSGESVAPQPTAIPSCSAGLVWDGGSCVCPGGTVWNGASCENPAPSCPGGQSWNGSACVCPGDKIWNGATCESPVISCQSGQIWNGSSCECPGGTVWNGSSCVNPAPVCGAGQHEENGACVNDTPVCGPGQYFDGSQCVDPAPVCGAGQHVEGNMCVDDPPPPTGNPDGGEGF